MEFVFDDEVIQDLLWGDVRRPRIIRERSDYFETLDDTDFIKRFRLSKRMALHVLSLIEEKLEFPYEKNDSIAPMAQLLCALRFYATNFDLLTAGDYCGFSKSTAFRVVKRVTCAIAELFQLFIQFPESDRELSKNKLDFYAIASFPNVVGAIDCTHVRINSPGGNNAETFRNRKNYFSINVQAICNANMEFIDVVARWPGSCHDSTIFGHSFRNTKFLSGVYRDSVLLGDAGYACSRYLLTPLDEPRTEAEHLYNESHIRTRNVVERTFGVWKRRFPVLAIGLRLSLQNSLPVIVATAVLHNILRKAGEDLPPDDSDLNLPWDTLLTEGEMQETVPARQRYNEQFTYRNNLICNYFTSLSARQ